MLVRTKRYVITLAGHSSIVEDPDGRVTSVIKVKTPFSLVI